MTRGRLLQSIDGWTVTASSIRKADRAMIETIFSLGNGSMSCRAACPEWVHPEWNRPLHWLRGHMESVGIAGQTMLCPDWTGFDFNSGSDSLSQTTAKRRKVELALEMRTGILSRSFHFRDNAGRVTAFKVIRLISQDEPDLAWERFEITPLNYSGRVWLSAAVDGRVSDPIYRRRCPDVHSRIVETEQNRHLLVHTRDVLVDQTLCLGMTLHMAGGGIAACGPNDRHVLRHGWFAEKGVSANIDRCVWFGRVSAGEEECTRAQEWDVRNRDMSFLRVFEQHRTAWMRFWDVADVEVEGDPDTQFRIRLAIFHLGQMTGMPEAETDEFPAGGDLQALPFFTLTQPHLAEEMVKCVRPAGHGSAIRQDAEMALALVRYCQWMDEPKTGWQPVSRELFERVRRLVDALEESGEEDEGQTYRLPLRAPFDGCDRGYLIALIHAAIRGAAEHARHLKEHHPADWERLADDTGIADDELSGWAQTSAGLRIPFDRERRLFIPSEIDGNKLVIGQDATASVHCMLRMAERLPALMDVDALRDFFETYAAMLDGEADLEPGLGAQLAARSGRNRLALRCLKRALATEFEHRHPGRADAGFELNRLAEIWKTLVMGFAGLRPDADRLFMDPRLPDEWEMFWFGLRWKKYTLRFVVSRVELVARVVSGGGGVPLIVRGITYRIGSKTPTMVPLV